MEHTPQSSEHKLKDHSAQLPYPANYFESLPSSYHSSLVMPGKGLNLLCLDGGGIRGLSSLLILKQLMQNVAQQKDWDEPPKPCEFFDMIGGTSTGGCVF
jgi:Patatin-like phospholipase